MDSKLQKYATLVETGSYTAAARLLHTSQPALSMAIQSLEKHYGTPLLQRAGRGVVMTEAGRTVYDAAVQHRAVESAMRQSLLVTGGGRSRVSLGLIDSMAAMALLAEPSLFDELEEAADTSVHINSTAHLHEAVLNRQIQLACGVEHHPIDAALQAFSLGDEPLLFVCAPLLAATVYEHCTALTPVPFVGYIAASHTHRYVAEYLRQAGVVAQEIITSTSPDAMLGMVLRGRGAAVLPYLAVRTYLRQGRLVSVRLPQGPLIANRPIEFVKRKDTVLPDVLTAFPSKVAAALRLLHAECERTAGQYVAERGFIT